MATYTQILSWIEKSLENKKLKDYSIQIVGGSEKDQGYLGNIVFVVVEGTTEGNENSSLHMVVKHANNNMHLRKILSIKELFHTEIHMYSAVFPAFLLFQQQRHVTDSFSCVPELLYSTLSGDIEVLVLENLKEKGFEQHDRMKPMNSAHCKAVLEQYGKFHAVSFALRIQDPSTFDDLVQNLGDSHMSFFEKSNLGSIFNHSYSITLEMFEEKGDADLVVKLDSLLEGGCDKIVKKVIERMKEDPQSVITHGDCWCNNFLFKYGNGETDAPSEVAILDWQLSTVRSPVFDLSYFIFVVCSKTELDSLEELLGAYYNSFAAHLTVLGSNPDEVFSYADLKRHWKKYSIYGLIQVMSVLRLFLCDNDKAPSYDDIKEGCDFSDHFNSLSFGGDTIVYERLKGVISHYFEYMDTKV